MVKLKRKKASPNFGKIPRYKIFPKDFTLKPVGKRFKCNQTGEMVSMARAKKFILSKGKQLNPPKLIKNEQSQGSSGLNQQPKTSRKIKDFPSADPSYSVLQEIFYCYCPLCGRTNTNIEPGKIITCPGPFCNKKFLVKKIPVHTLRINRYGEIQCPICNQYSEVDIPGRSPIELRTEYCQHCGTEFEVYRQSVFSIF